MKSKTDAVCLEIPTGISNRQTLYDKRAAKTLNDIWGQNLEQAMKPVFTEDTTQYAEESVIVIFSFVTPCGSDWAPMSDTDVESNLEFTEISPYRVGRYVGGAHHVLSREVRGNNQGLCLEWH